MQQFLFLGAILFALTACAPQQASESNVITDDVDRFWQAYDQIKQSTDTLEQAQLLQDLYISKASPGLKAIMQVRDYDVRAYLSAIRDYPKFWESVRANTLKAKEYAVPLNEGIDKLAKIYSPLKAAKIYFTIGALRTNGTTLDSMVLIGSELAMADQHTVSNEFAEPLASGRRTFFDSNPIDNLVLLNVHEYVHTQQKPIVHNLLSQCLFEGVAEFVSVQAMGVPSSTPAVDFGKNNHAAVVQAFEREMFRGGLTYKWLWSGAENNEFNIRDLGYYIGYEICERYYANASDKKAAIKTMVELDYEDEAAVEAFVDGTGFLSASLETLYQNYEADRPKVIKLEPFDNGSEEVSAGSKIIKLHFSEAVDQRYRNFDYGPLGEATHLPLKRFIGFAEDGQSISFEVELAPNKHYQLTIGSGFRDLNGTPLKPYVIDIKTQ